MKIVVLDGYTLNPGDISWSAIEALGELTVYDRTPADEIVTRIGNAEAVFVNKVPISGETLAACPSLSFICVLATGYNIVDVEAAKERGIPVANIPTYGTASVAQMVFAHLLEICHHVDEHARSVREGAWAEGPDWCFWRHPLIELEGKTMGIIGFGRIGQAVGRVANAFGMNVLAHDTYRLSGIESDTLRYAELDELLAGSDVISLHCPLFSETHGLINRETIAKMKNGAILINTARGPLVNEADLAEALNSGKLAAAGLDVMCVEPPKAMDNPLFTAKNCNITPHIAWAPKESRARLMAIAANNLKAFLAGTPTNVVNL